jgi:hypothetical protein
MEERTLHSGPGAVVLTPTDGHPAEESGTLAGSSAEVNYEVVIQAESNVTALARSAGGVRLTLSDATGHPLIVSDGQSLDDPAPSLKLHVAAGSYLLTLEAVQSTAIPYFLQVTTNTAVDPNVPFKPIWLSYHPPYNVVVDLTGDGIPDVFTGQGALFEGQGDGTFKFKESYPFNKVQYNNGTNQTYEPSVWSVHAADVNGDGRLDLLGAVEFSRQGGYAAVRLANADSTYQPEVDYPTLGEDTVSLAVGDVNNDGRADIITCNNDFIHSKL